MFAFIADSHVALRGLRPEIPQEDTLRPLRTVAEFVKSKKIPLVVGGDLYDTNSPPARLVAQVNGILSGAEVYLIQGNHDRDPETPWGVLCPGVKHIHGKLTEIGGLKVYGLDFAPSSTIAVGIQGMPKCDVVVIHQALKQGLGFEGAWNLDLDLINPDKTRNVLAGDLHGARDELYSKDKLIHALYPGAQYMTTIAEPSDPMFILVKGMRPDGYLDYQRVPLPHRPFLAITVRSPAEVAEALEAFNTNLPKERPIIKVSYPADAVSLLAGVTEGIGELAYIVASPLPVDRFSTSRKYVVQVRKGITLGGLIEQKLKEDPDEGFKTFMKDLSCCMDKDCVANTITGFREESLKGQA